MRLTKTMQDAMNQQVAHEFSAAYLYLSMAAYFGAKSLNGFSQWMRVQAREEAVHAMKFFDFIEDRGGRVQLPALEQPRAEFGSPLEVFEYAAEHEAKVSAGIHRLYEMAQKDKDYASQAMLQWFITEQVEEEKTSTRIVETLRMIGDNASGLYMFDKELGQRQARA